MTGARHAISSWLLVAGLGGYLPADAVRCGLRALGSVFIATYVQGKACFRLTELISDHRAMFSGVGFVEA